MKKLLAGSALADEGGAEARAVRVTRAGSQASVAGPASFFTGRVRIDGPFSGSGGARAGGASVTFEPGARTAWHTHPLGQTLIVTAGAGRVQQWGGPVQTHRAGYRGLGTDPGYPDLPRFGTCTAPCFIGQGAASQQAGGGDCGNPLFYDRVLQLTERS